MDELAQLVAGGRLDFALIGVCGDATPSAEFGLGWQEVAVDPVCVLLPRDHPLAERRRGATWPTCADEQWVAAPGDGCFGDCFAAACARAGFTPRKVYETDVRGCVDLVDAGEAVALCQATFRPVAGLVTRPLAGHAAALAAAARLAPGLPGRPGRRAGAGDGGGRVHRLAGRRTRTTWPGCCATRSSAPGTRPTARRARRGCERRDAGYQAGMTDLYPRRRRPGAAAPGGRRAHRRRPRRGDVPAPAAGRARPGRHHRVRQPAHPGGADPRRRQAAADAAGLTTAPAWRPSNHAGRQPGRRPGAVRRRPGHGPSSGARAVSVRRGRRGPGRAGRAATRRRRCRAPASRPSAPGSGRPRPASPRCPPG